VPVGPFGLDPLIWGPLRLVIAVALALFLVLNGALLQIYLERRSRRSSRTAWARNHVGPFGLLQTFADAIKLIAKEDVRARATDPWFFLAAPALVFCPMARLLVVLLSRRTSSEPTSTSDSSNLTTLGFDDRARDRHRRMGLEQQVRARRWPALGGQLISYEIPQILALVSVALVVGSLSMVDITRSQPGPLVNVLVLPLSFVIYFIAALAETNRTPFDLPEAESELVAAGSPSTRGCDGARCSRCRSTET